jgi:hypothetical protein
MKKKLFTHGVTFYLTEEMYAAALTVTNDKELGISELMRNLLSSYLQDVETNQPLTSRKGD